MRENLQFEEYILNPILELLPENHHKEVKDIFSNLAGYEFYIPKSVSKGTVITLVEILRKKHYTDEQIVLEIQNKFNIKSRAYIVNRYLK